MKTKIFWIIPIFSILFGIRLFLLFFDKSKNNLSELTFDVIPPLAIIVTGYVLARSLEKLFEKD